MAPQKPYEKDDKAMVPNKPTTSTGAGGVKRRNKKVMFHKGGLLNVERKTGKYFKMARQNQQQSPLLRLPAELRNKIFTYALGGKTLEIGWRSDSIDAMVLTNLTKYKHALALLQVCRQIYAETTLLPFSTNNFSVSSPYVLDHWVESFHPVRVQSITWVQVKLSFSEAKSIFKSNCLYDLRFNEPLEFPEISNRGHVVLSLDVKKRGRSRAAMERILEEITRMFRARHKDINFVWE